MALKSKNYIDSQNVALKSKTNHDPLFALKAPMCDLSIR